MAMHIPSARLSVVTLLIATTLCGCGQKTNPPPREEDASDKIPSAPPPAAPQVVERKKADLDKALAESRDSRAEPKAQKEPKVVKDSDLVFVKSSAKLECSQFGAWSLSGVIINHTGVDLIGLTIRVSFFDKNGVQIGTGNTTHTGLDNGH